MITWIYHHWDTLNIAISIAGFALSVAVIAYSSLQFVRLKIAEDRKERFRTYHDLVRAITTGLDAAGPMKIASQRAYIYELRRFKDYAPLTIRLLEHFRDELKDRDSRVFTVLDFEISETIKCLTRR